MKIIGKGIFFLVCCGLSISAYAFMPLECTPALKDNTAPERLAKRTDIDRTGAVTFFIQSTALLPARQAVHAQRKAALYRARNIFNQNASGLKIQIIETSITNPLTWGLLSAANNILFRSNYEFPFIIINAAGSGAGGIAISMPNCTPTNNSISSAHIFLNDTPGFYSTILGKWVPSNVGVSIPVPTTPLIEVQPWLDYPNLIPNYLRPSHWPYFRYYTMPPGVIQDEIKNEHVYYADRKDMSLVELALHEIGHTLGMNHEGREINNMGIGNASANGDYLMDWIGQDMTQFLNKVYPRDTSVNLEYRDLSVRQVKQASYTPGFPLNYNLLDIGNPINPYNPLVHQTNYATITRSEAYPFHYATSDYAGDQDIYFDYDRNPKKCMVLGNSYYVEFAYENNSSIDNEGSHQVTFLLSKDDNIVTADPNNPNAAVSLVDLGNNVKDFPLGQELINFNRDPMLSTLVPAYDPSGTGVFGTDYLSYCYKSTKYCNVTVRMSKMKIDSETATHALKITKNSLIAIPSMIPPGQYFVGPYISPVKDSSGNVLEANLENNATYLEVNLVDPAVGC